MFVKVNFGVVLTQNFNFNICAVKLQLKWILPIWYQFNCIVKSLGPYLTSFWHRLSLIWVISWFELLVQKLYLSFYLIRVVAIRIRLCMAIYAKQASQKEVEKAILTKLSRKELPPTVLASFTRNKKQSFFSKPKCKKMANYYPGVKKKWNASGPVRKWAFTRTSEFGKFLTIFGEWIESNTANPAYTLWRNKVTSQVILKTYMPDIVTDSLIY